MEPGERPESSTVTGSSGRHRKPPNPKAMRIARVAIVCVAVGVLLVLIIEVVRLTADSSDTVTAQRPGAPMGMLTPVASPSATGGRGLATVEPSPAATATPRATATPTATRRPEEVRTSAGAPTAASSLAARQLTRLSALRADAADSAPVAQAPLGENVLTVPGREVGSWEGRRLPNGMSVGANNDRAIKAGAVVTYEQFPRATSTARIRLPSGQRYTAPVISAYEAHLAMRETGGPACPDCQDVVLTGVRSTTMRQPTDAGDITVPAWEFTVRDSKVKLIRPAVGAAGLIRLTPAWRGTTDAGLEASQLPLWRPALSKNQRVITARIESKDVASRRGCWRLFASETDEAVAVYAAKGPAGASGACADRAGVVSVRLSAPLGGRTVVDTYWQRVLALR